MILVVVSIYSMDTRIRLNSPDISENPAPASISPAGDNPSGLLAAEDSGEAAGQPTPEVSGDPGKSEAEIEQIVRNAASAAENYRKAYSVTNEFVSKNGLLYDFPAEMYVSIKDLTEEDGFNMAFSNESAMILYVKAGDMPADISAGLKMDQLAVFAAIPYGSDYIASNGVGTSEISAAAMKSLQDRYNSDHGKIGLVRGDTAEFAVVMAAVENSPGLADPLDVRYMAEDGKYISTVVSPHGNPAFIKEFILQKTANGGVKVLIDNIEGQEEKFVAINSSAPDVNLDLVPPYNLSGNIKDIKTDFTALLKSMASSGIISQDDGDPVFISGNSVFVFMEFGNGVRMLAHNDDGRNDWKVYQVLRYEDAIARMKELSIYNPPPYFLIKQN